MKILRLTLSNFRGFATLTMVPKGHVLVFGVPGGGRSDIVEAISRVLDDTTLRRRAANEMDFHTRNVDVPATVEVVLGSLDEDLRQRFIDDLEVWSHESDTVLEELEEPEEIDLPAHEFIVRLKYRAAWIEDEERADEIVYLSKRSDESASAFQRARRSDLEALPFARLNPRERVLDLGAQGAFRALVENSAGADFSQAIRDYVKAIDDQASSFVEKEQVRNAFVDVIGPIGEVLRAGGREPKDIVRLVPEGGVIGGVLRSLTPAIDLLDGGGHLPIYRHRSSLGAVIRLAEALTLVRASNAVIVSDDFSEDLDGPTAMHMASLLRSTQGQAWLFSREAAVAGVFDPPEIFRLSFDTSGARVVHQGRVPANRSERVAWKHWQRNVLPALSYAAAAVMEGPDDRLSVNAVSIRRSRDAGVPPLGANSIAVIDAGHAGSGGSTGVPKLASLAKAMGLWTVGIIDWDKANADVILADAVAASDCLIRLPEGFAIEKLLIDGVSTEDLRTALKEIVDVSGIQPEWDVATLDDADLRKRGVELLKNSGGLHESYVEALPDGVLPPKVVELIDTIIDAVRNKRVGHIQL
jgi:hypothetical protein